MAYSLSNVTAIINNFLRPEYTKKCVESLRENYPQVKILVGNGDKPDPDLEQFVKDNGGDYIELPFDGGICVARNRMVEHVKTKYCLIGDDDFYYSPDAHLEIMLDFMGIADVCGGRVREKGLMRDYQGFMEIKDNQLVYRRLLLDAWQHYHNYRYKDCDITFNFFIAPTKRLKETKWDEKIKVSYEHSDWFLLAKEAGMRVVFTPHCVVDHKPELDVKTDFGDYHVYRNRRVDRDHFFHKRGLKSAVDMNGFMDIYSERVKKI
jgi:GT2 family glycosyltransferase